MSTLHVSCAVEGAYVAHSAAMLHSVLAKRGALGVHVHYLHGRGLPVEARRMLAEMVVRHGGELTFHEVAPERVEGLPVQSMFTVAMWYRVFLPELLPEVGRVLYLDVDTIVADSLEPLWSSDLDGYWLGAVTNVFQQNDLGRSRALGLPANDVYFNSGVLLMNLEEMRRDRRTEAVLETARGRDLGWPDQDALNLALGERRLPLHPRWNRMNSMLFPHAAGVFGAGEVEDARRRPGILHFEGPGRNKPWHFLCKREWRELYAEHRRQTPWPSYRPEGRTPANVLRRLMR